MSVNLNNFFRGFLFYLIVVYFLQGSLYASGSIIAKISLFFILFISSIYSLKVLLIKSKKPIFIIAWFALLVLNIIGFIYESVFSGIYYAQFRNILTAILPFFPFYYFAYKGALLEKHLLHFFIMLVPVAVWGFVVNINNELANRISANENIVSNMAYFFVALIPYVFLWGKKRFMSILSLIVLLFFVIQGSKRGAIIIAALQVLIFIYYNFMVFKSDNRIKDIVVAIIGILLIFSFSYNLYLSNEFLIERLSGIGSDGGSGRDVMFLNLWSNWYESNSLINYIFGFGFASTLLYSGVGLFAHNDWFELLTNFGLLGIIIYLWVISSAFYFIIDNKNKKQYRIIMLSIMVMWLLKTFFSMYYTDSITILTSLLLGYLFGRSFNDRLRQNSDNA